MTTEKTLYEYTGALKADNLEFILLFQKIDAEVIESTCGRLFIQTDQPQDRLFKILDVSLTPASVLKRQRGKPLDWLRKFAIQQATGTVEEIAEAYGYSIKTVRRVRAEAEADEKLADTPVGGSC